MGLYDFTKDSRGLDVQTFICQPGGKPRKTRNRTMTMIIARPGRMRIYFASILTLTLRGVLSPFLLSAMRWLEEVPQQWLLLLKRVSVLCCRMSGVSGCSLL